MSAMDQFFFVVFPYIAFAVFVIGAIYRYRTAPFEYSSLSSQFLEGRRAFWGSVPFHLGILAILLGHLIMFLLPNAILLLNADPVRLVVHEILAFSAGVVALLGLANLVVRRWLNARLRVVTSRMDLAVELLLLVQIVLGCWIAVGYRWGSSWFASDLSPYLWSLFRLAPRTAAVAAMPLPIKLHIIGAFLLLFLVPFSRLVHFLVAPLNYLWRPYQVVIWNWDRKRIRRADAGLSNSGPG